MKPMENVSQDNHNKIPSITFLHFEPISKKEFHCLF